MGAKTEERAPQALVVPEMLRPILRDWWKQHGRPTEGMVSSGSSWRPCCHDQNLGSAAGWRVVLSSPGNRANEYGGCEKTHPQTETVLESQRNPPAKGGDPSLGHVSQSATFSLAEAAQPSENRVQGLACFAPDAPTMGRTGLLCRTTELTYVCGSRFRFAAQQPARQRSWVGQPT